MYLAILLLATTANKYVSTQLLQNNPIGLPIGTNLGNALDTGLTNGVENPSAFFNSDLEDGLNTTTTEEPTTTTTEQPTTTTEEPTTTTTTEGPTTITTSGPINININGMNLGNVLDIGQISSVNIPIDVSDFIINDMKDNMTSTTEKPTTTTKEPTTTTTTEQPTTTTEEPTTTTTTEGPINIDINGKNIGNAISIPDVEIVLTPDDLIVAPSSELQSHLNAIRVTNIADNSIFVPHNSVRPPQNQINAVNNIVSNVMDGDHSNQGFQNQGKNSVNPTEIINLVQRLRRSHFTV